MNLKQSELKEKLGNGYSFSVMIPPKKLSDIIFTQDIRYANQTAFQLNVGQLNLEIVVIYVDNTVTVGCYCCVKDRPENGEWIVFDRVSGMLNIYSETIENDMFDMLDSFAVENELSYTEWNGETIMNKAYHYEADADCYDKD